VKHVAKERVKVGGCVGGTSREERRVERIRSTETGTPLMLADSDLVDGLSNTADGMLAVRRCHVYCSIKACARICMCVEIHVPMKAAVTSHARVNLKLVPTHTNTVGQQPQLD